MTPTLPTEALEPRRLLASTLAETTALADTLDRSVDGGFAVTVNFQPDGMANVAGTRGDYGRLYAERGNGLTYGWNRDLEAAGDIVDRDSDRDLFSLRQSTAVGNGPAGEDQGVDERYDTVALVDVGDEWSIDVPDDRTYAIAVVVGDPEMTGPSGTSWTYLDVEGDLFINANLRPYWPFAEATGYVTPGDDGRITISVDERTTNGRLLWVRIAEVEPLPTVAEGETIDWDEVSTPEADEAGLPRSPVQRAEGGGEVVDGELILIGGFQHGYTGVWRRADAADIATGEQRELADIPEGAADTHGAVASDPQRGLVYWVAGNIGLGPEGETSYEQVTDTAWALDPDGGEDGNGAWTSLPDLPDVRTAAAAFVSGDRLHVLGGGGEDGILARRDHWALDLTAALDGDPATPATWEAQPPLPVAVNHMQIEVDYGGGEFGGDVAYVVAGEYDHGLGYSTTRHLQIYDLDTASWSLGPEAPVAVSHHATVLQDDRIWVFGGQVLGNLVTNAVQSYDLGDGVWRTHNPLVGPRKIGSPFYDADRGAFIYVAGDTRQFGIRDDILVGVLDDGEDDEIV